MSRVPKGLRWPSDLLNWYADEADATDTPLNTLAIGVLAAHRDRTEDARHRAGNAPGIGDATDRQLADALRFLADERSRAELTAGDAALIIAIRAAADRLDGTMPRTDGSRLYVDVAIVSEQTHRALAPEVCRQLRGTADEIETATGRIERRIEWPDIDAWVHDPGHATRSGVIQ